jgi:hypothetical protein
MQFLLQDGAVAAGFKTGNGISHDFLVNDFNGFFAMAAAFYWTFGHEILIFVSDIKK